MITIIFCILLIRWKDQIKPGDGFDILTAGVLLDLLSICLLVALK